MSTVAGQLIDHTFDYDGGRQVTVYLPSEPARAVVFAADGGWHTTSLAEVMETGGAAPVAIIGVHGRVDDDERLKEYSPRFDPARFAAHEQFLVDEVGRWAQTRFGLTVPPERTAIWGASLGGELAIALALRHPEVFGVALSASPGAGFRPPAGLQGPLPRLYLVAGTEEPFFRDNAIRWADAMREAGGDVVLTERAGTHGGAFWLEEFPLMLRWAFGAEPFAGP